MGKKSKRVRPSRAGKKKKEEEETTQAGETKYFQMDEDGWINLPPNATRPGAMDYLNWLTDYEKGGTEAVNKQCFFCKKYEDELGHALSKCSGCGCVYYCNKKCQTKDWHLLHKRMCAVIKEEKANIKTKEKEKMKDRGISSKTEYRAEFIAEDDFVENTIGLSRAMGRLAFWWENWGEEGKATTGKEKAAFVIHVSSVAAFEGSPFEELRGLCVVTLTPWSFLAAGVWVDEEWGKENAKQRASTNAFDNPPATYEMIWLKDHQTIGVRGKMPHQRVFHKHSPIYPMREGLSEDETDKWMMDAWNEQVKAVKRCLEHKPSPIYLSEELFNQHMSQVPFDWQGLATSEEFRNWAANKTWGAMKWHGTEEAAMVTFFVNRTLISELDEESKQEDGSIPTSA